MPVPRSDPQPNADPPSTTAAQEPPTGPVPIDPALLHLVSGGGPKGTWIQTEQLASEGPKGTW